jgi:hypothetical protein
MSERERIRTTVLETVKKAAASIPDRQVPRQPPSAELSGEPAWQPFEHVVWDAGEAIRQLLVRCPALRRDPEVQEGFLRIATDRRAHRGRQSFIMLLGFKACAQHATRLVQELADPNVDGHVIWALNRMKVPDFSRRIEPFMTHEKAWIRKEATRYVAWNSEKSGNRRDA